MGPRVVRCIHVGVGNRGAFLLDLFAAEAARFKPVAFVDLTRQIALGESRRRGWKTLPCFASLAEAAGRVEADACVITSPARFHAEQMRTALEHGLHVFVAKPMTYELREAVALVAEADRRGLVIVVDQQQRFSLTERTLAEWVRANKHGDLGYGSFIIHRHRPEMRAFTGDNPFIWEQGVHSFDSLRAMLGREVVAVQARQTKPPWSGYNGPTVSMGLLEFAGGVPVQYLGTFDSRQFEIEMRFEFAQAAVRVAATDWRKALSIAPPGGSFAPAGISDAQDADPAERFSLANFHHAIVTEGRVPNDGRDNLHTLAVVDAFIRSAAEGQRVPVAAV